MTEREILAKTIWGEARGEGTIGQEAVASVVLNRARLAADYRHRKGRNHALYGDGSITGVCQAPWQFSCWNAGDPNLPKMGVVDASDRRYRSCLEVADRALSGELEDVTRGATHYHTVAAPRAAKTWPPSWAHHLTSTVTIGAHIFYR